MNMNYKELWESIGKFFYTANLSLLISSLIVWDTSLLDLIPRFFNKELYLIWIFVGVLLLLVYFIIDWLDANFVSSIDNEVRITDIVFWLLAPISLSLTLTILLKKGIDMKSSFWLYIGVNFYILFNAIILLFRNSLIYEERRNNEFGKNKDAYDKLLKIRLIEKFIGYVYLLFLGVINILIYCFHKISIKDCEHWILILFVSLILLNTILKYYRCRYINYEYYKYKMNKKQR